MADPESWDGYPEELKAKWRNNYAQRKEELLEDSLPDDEAKNLAEELIANGFKQASRKYRKVSRLKPPKNPGDTYMDQLKSVKPEAVKHLKEKYKELMELEAKSILRFTEELETRDLDERTFDWFRKICKETGTSVW